MKSKFLYWINRTKEQLWFKPLIFCILSVFGALMAHSADGLGYSDLIPSVSKDSLKGLLNTISASMLVISTFAVGSMISAFSSASNMATPRSFRLIIADDVSQNALSVFIGSFIYSVVARIALENEFYGDSGVFILFVITCITFAVVIFTFVRWVDQISKLGRLNPTIIKIENATLSAVDAYKKQPYLSLNKTTDNIPKGFPLYANQAGYVQNIDIEALNNIAQEVDCHFHINAMPGSFTFGDKSIVKVAKNKRELKPTEKERVINTFNIALQRTFEEDPRFGLIALSEIASRALSPGINDPGTAIAVLNSHVRIFKSFAKPEEEDKKESVMYERVSAEELEVEDLFNDAFRPIARDGSGNVEVMMRLQKVFRSISLMDNKLFSKAAINLSRQSYKRAEMDMKLPEDLDVLKSICLCHDED
jgi:uncharacterized membrane protein